MWRAPFFWTPHVWSRPSGWVSDQRGAIASLAGGKDKQKVENQGIIWARWTEACPNDCSLEIAVPFS